MGFPVKTQDISLLAWVAVPTATAVMSSVLDLIAAPAKFAATIFVYLGRQSGSAFTTGWPNIRISASPKSAGNDAWVPLDIYRPFEGLNIVNTTLNGAIIAGATSCIVTSATGIAAGDLLFLGDASSANWEIVRVLSVSGTTINFEEACTYAHGNGAQVTDQADIYQFNVDAMAYGRLRVVADNASGGQTFAVRVLAITGNSVT